MDEKYQEFFSKQTVDKWSLMDYNNWLIKNFDHNQPVKSHRKFYSILTDILVNDDSSAKTTKAKFLLKNKKKDSKNANLLLKNPKILKIIHEVPEKWKKEEKK
ncbi:hypothetical protein RhiirA4_420037 [Rhizophagus irregularis]|uniref:Uncharacterized protein n=1 Tax=Rhizophagus irregularis TaxID=588596 RepID=A0A2I1GGC5_9GLOM|nr:hypothetical protein RhiirA4_420037 [Rhizophagus irregularis]